MKKVVITGIGILSSIGNNQKEVLQSLLNSLSGITFSEEFKCAGMRSNVWGDIKINIAETFINKNIVKFMHDGTIYAYLAMQEAIKDSCLHFNQYANNSNVGIVVGSAGCSARSKILSINLMNKGIKNIPPFSAIKSMNSGISACLGTFFNLKGINYSINSACATSANCIGHAYELIKFGQQKIIFAGGGEALNWELACEFDAMRVLSTRYNNFPKRASRAYDCKRDGFVISGGGGIIVLEELQHALSRNAKIYGEIIGFSTNSDGYSLTKPSGSGLFKCIKKALTDIHEKVDYINTHAASTKIGDITELLAIKKFFNNYKPFISSTKSITGHSLGVSGVHELIYVILMLNNNFIAPSININKLDKNAFKMNIINSILYKKFNVGMSNSLGFGGVNVVIILKKYHG
ncbi:beta-ketoacyl synthase N-terminal-like domain-containing protein [Buchnera aphidicola (Mollitrichosiphum nigrofasciatum)]|uniref:beta-ketoacyl synthase N-terminal-like domain-containing protein n=1 Tax=Buchnera aphidicola TaxID=9 RepID=UPI0031B85B9D